MEFSLHYFFDRSILSSTPGKAFISFEEKRKCLNYVFWSAWRSLKDKKRCLLVVSSDEELEYLNYFISRFQLQKLSLVIDGHSEMQPSYVSERIKGKEMPPTDMASFRHDFEKLENRLDRLQDNLDIYHEPCLGKINLVEAARRVAESPYPEIRAELYPAIPLDAYRQKKQIIEKASEIYRTEFRYNDSFRIFNKAIFREYDAASILGVLKEISEDTEKLLEDFESFYQLVHRTLQKQKLSEIEELKKDFRRLERIAESRKNLFDDTESRKLGFLSKTMLDKFAAGERFKDNPIEDLGTIKSLLEDKVREINETVGLELKEVLRSLNTNNSDFDPSDIFNRCNQLMTRVNASSIFSGNYECFCFSFQSYRDWAKGLIQLLDKAVYLLSFEEPLLQWHILMNSIPASDRALITELLDNRTDWLACFEDAYLRSFVKARTAETDNISKMHDELVELWKACESNAFQELYSQFNNINEGEEIKLIQSESWGELLKQEADKLFGRFPLILLKESFYVENGAELLSQSDSVLFVNSSGIKPEAAAKAQVQFCSYDEQCTRNLLPLVKGIEGCEIEHVPGVAFNVNRSAHFLNPSERHNLSLYLAYGIRHFNSSYRIFQTRDHSIISLLRYDRNNRLISFMEGQGLKEIFSNEEGQNLLPGIFNDKSKRVLVLLEDQLINPDKRDSLMQQKLLLEEIRISGFTILSVDNYRLFSQGSDGMEQLLKKELERNSEMLVSL